MKAKVLRRLSAQGKVYNPGDVDDFNGPHLFRLVEQRYLQPVEDEPAPAPKADAKRSK